MADEETNRVVSEAWPMMQARLAEDVATKRRLREAYGVHINYVSPIEWQGAKVWAIGSRVYLNRPRNETFHEFLASVLRGTLGEDWRAAQATSPEGERHFLLMCSEEWGRFTSENRGPTTLGPDGVYSARPNGWAQYFLSLAWDVATLIHTNDLPNALVNRLRDPTAFQGARYEVAVAAVFARLDCEIRMLDEEDALRGDRRVEFVATHRPTGQEIAVEAKSRHRPGVLNVSGDFDTADPLRGDNRGVRALFAKALKKAPERMAFLVFIDINAPLEASTRGDWQQSIQSWIDRMPPSTAEDPAVYNALYVTNFSPHYQGDGLAPGSDWLGVVPACPCVPLSFDLTPTLERALSTYHAVPAITTDGHILG